MSPQGWRGKLADKLMAPIMYLGAGTFQEVPQRTHRWNNAKLKPEDIAHLLQDQMVTCEGDPEAIDMGWIRFHLPIFGGWQNYVVLEPLINTTWHVGWITPRVIGISRIELLGPVRVLLGPHPISFFAVDWKNNQRPVRKIGEGKIGDGGEFSRVPLL